MNTLHTDVEELFLREMSFEDNYYLLENDIDDRIVDDSEPIEESIFGVDEEDEYDEYEEDGEI